MEKKILTRKELYDLAWTEPLSMIALKYSVSFNGLRKVCMDMNIPIPTNGHWQKIRFGKPIVIANLPTDYSGSEEINLELIRKPIDNPDSPDKNVLKTKSIDNGGELAHKVPHKLINPDTLITSTMSYYAAVKRYDYNSGSGYPSHKEVLNIAVSDESKSRALIFMDAIIKLLRARQYEILCKNYKTYAALDGEEIEIRLRERNKVSSVKSQWGSRQLESTKKLIFIIGDYHRKEIGDGKEPLESKISTILAIIDTEAEQLKQQRIENEKWRRLQEEKRRIEQEIREQKDNESRKFKNLFLNATRLHQANILRTYIQALESNAIKNGNLTTDKEEWLQWAKKKADWYDPLINGEDPLLDNNYKTNIFKEFLKEWQ